MQADLTLLLSSFPAQDRANPEQVIGAYMIALADYPAEAIHDGIVSLVRGEAPEHEGGQWLPSTAIVGRVVKRQPSTAMKAVEDMWLLRAAAWKDGRWNPHWGQGPDSPSFSAICPPRLHAAFGIKRIAS
ncbi:hypothetical protein AB4099_18900 [Bosea sp. 2KB_26]|uniref:hypothetical protein n=1 Tax=Bosea sp. 2KB_26 TaxID=3237475 RepID=UPI003F92D6CC